MHEREHGEGGFTLYKGLPDGKNTYYGLRILKIFNEEPYNKNNTIRWIKKLNKGKIFGIKGVFYRLNSLKLFEMNTEIPDEYASKLMSKIAFNSLETAFLSTNILKIAGYNDLQDIADWILSFLNEEGGFGVSRSDIVSSYYAIESLNQINPSLITSKNKMIKFVEHCRAYNGVFCSTPINYPPYIETIFAGIRIHEIVNSKVKNPTEIINFVLNLRNKNGGFRRSKYMGISELEYTFKALYILKSLNYNFK